MSTLQCVSLGLKLGRPGDLGPSEPLGDGRPQSFAVPVRLPSATQDQVCSFALGNCCDHFAECYGIKHQVSCNVDRTISSKRQGAPQHLFILCGTNCDCNHFHLARTSALAQTNGLLHAVFIHGVHHQRRAGQVYSVIAQAKRAFGVGHLANQGQDLHYFSVPSTSEGATSAQRLSTVDGQKGMSDFGAPKVWDRFLKVRKDSGQASAAPRTVHSWASQALKRQRRTMSEVVIVSGVRTPVGKFQGALSEFSATDLGA